MEIVGAARLTKDCGSCRFCQDMIKFGGKGILYKTVLLGEKM